MRQRDRQPEFSALLQRRPQAWARLEGDDKHPALGGLVRFYTVPLGVLTVAELGGLEERKPDGGAPAFFPEIRKPPAAPLRGRESGAPCASLRLPPLTFVRGYAFSAFLGNSFSVREIIGGELILSKAVERSPCRLPPDRCSVPFPERLFGIASGIIRDR